MGHARFALVTVNAVAFFGLLGVSLSHWYREASPRVRKLWLVVAMVSAALVIGSIQRVVIQAAALGWLPVEMGDAAIMRWQVVQSVAVWALAMGSFMTVRKVTRALRATERVAGSLIDRVSHIDVDSLELSERERDVLMRIGLGLLTDEELSGDLHIARSTVQSHIKSLLRKTGLKRRQDLVAVAALLDLSA